MTGQSRLAEHFIQSLSIKQPAALHHASYSLGVTNVAQRAGLKQYEISSAIAVGSGNSMIALAKVNRGFESEWESG